ncbi:MAG: hypothetical protein KTR15_07980 [Phycisphaeraceae bacterium]|nr:hypothetical protein [Phycisphaeraceae bacterium]
MPPHQASPAPRRLLTLKVWLAAWAVLVLATAPAWANQQALVNAQWTNRNDSLGMMWDLRNGGYVDDGTNNCFNNAMLLQVSNNNVNFTSHQMTLNGQLYVFNGNHGAIQINRRVTIDPKFPGLRYVDTFYNPSQQPVTVPATYYTRISSNAQAILTDTGSAFNSGTLGKKDSGLVLFRTGAQPSVVLQFSAPGSKIKPTITNSNNYQFQVTYNLQVPAGKKVTLISGIGQRTLTAAPANRKELRKLFKPFQDRGFVKGVPRELMRSAVNWKGGMSGDAPVLYTIERDLETEPRDDADVLAIGEETRIRGKASWDRVSIKTQFGDFEPPAERVAAIAGPRFSGGVSRIYLRDGQVLAGQLTVDNLKIELAGGSSLSVAGERLDRLVTRKRPAATASLSDGFDAVVDTFQGDRIMIRSSDDQPLGLTAVTPYGNREIALAELQWLQMRTDQQPAYEFALTDGSRFVGLLEQQTLAGRSELFGEIVFNATDVRFVTTATPSPDDSRPEPEVAPSQASVQLTNGQRLVGQFEQSTVELLTLSGMLELPTDQVRELEQVGDDAQVPGRGGAVYQVSLWDGSQVVGRFEKPLIRIAASENRWEVPSHAVERYTAPTPVLSEQARAKIILLIRDLGSDNWKAREQATEELLALGPMAAERLRQTVQQTRDLEVRRRAEAILAEID